MRRWVGIGFLLVCFWSTPAYPQALVLDAANLVESTLQTIQQFLFVANQVIDLTGMAVSAEEIAAFAEEVRQLQLIVQSADGLAWDVTLLVSQIDRLFSPTTAPRGTSETLIRLREIRMILYKEYARGMTVQSIVTLMVHTIEHAIQLYHQIAAWLGNAQGHQHSQRLSMTMIRLQSQMQMQQAAYHRVQTVEKMNGPWVTQAIENTNVEIVADWPR